MTEENDTEARLGDKMESAFAEIHAIFRELGIGHPSWADDPALGLADQHMVGLANQLYNTMAASISDGVMDRV